MPNPLENKLLLSYMSGLGGAMGGEDSAAQAIGGITQQYIGAESKHKLQLQYIQMLKQMFAGGGKMNMDKDNISFKAPISVFGGESSELAGAFQIPGYGQAQAGVAGTKAPEVPNYVNPSVSPLDVGSVDLAGLTTKDVTEALQSALGVGELGRKKISDISEAAYYGTARRKMEAEIRAKSEMGRPFIGNFTLEQFKALTPGDKEYLLAKEGARILGDTDFMSKREWEETEPTERQRFLRGLKDRPELLKMEEELAEAKHVPSELTPVNWTTATKELNKRFGKLDPTGMWAVTPELQATHRRAQDLLVDFKDAGMDPLRAVNEAETQAREWKYTIERDYTDKIMEAQEVKDKSERKEEIEWINSEFYRQYKYLPARRRS